MENDIDDVLGENKTEDLGDREPGGAVHDFLLIGTDEEIRVLLQNDRQPERLYLSRDDERLGLNENHEEYLMENED
jgi:hypothetical protein